MSYFLPPARPDLDQFVVESEVVPDLECNLLTGGVPTARVSSRETPPSVSVGGVSALTDGSMDSPAAARKRSGSTLGKARK